MTPPADTPRLPKWPFLLADAGLLAAAWFIASRADPLTGTPLIVAAVCVVLGSVCAVLPFLAEYARKQDEALNERERALDSLSRTVASAAEQIGIVANGLHQITEIAQRNLKSAEHLPHKLQEKIAEFKAQLDNVTDDEKEELEKEVAELRASESDRLEATADKISKVAADLARLEASAHQHLAATQEALTQAATAAEHAATRQREQAVNAIDGRLTAALAEIDAKLGLLTGTLAAKVEASASVFDTKIAALTAATNALSVAPSSPSNGNREPTANDAESTQPLERNTTEQTHSPEPAQDDSPADTSAEDAPTSPAPVASPEIDHAVEVTAAPAETAASVAPISPAPAGEATAAAVATEAEIGHAPAATPTETPKSEPPRKRAPRKPKVEPEPAPDVPFALMADEPMPDPAAAVPPPNEFAQVSPDDVGSGAEAERSVSVDGLTRLLVTAYIGIGNRLFIRGEGPGLSWEKGIPLQFVSIGKWRWETADATAPVAFKVYKNDSVECSGLGTQSIEPGQQAEVTATF